MAAARIRILHRLPRCGMAARVEDLEEPMGDPHVHDGLVQLDKAVRRERVSDVNGLRQQIEPAASTHSTDEGGRVLDGVPPHHALLDCAGPGLRLDRRRVREAPKGKVELELIDAERVVHRLDASPLLLGAEPEFAQVAVLPAQAARQQRPIVRREEVVDLEEHAGLHELAAAALVAVAAAPRPRVDVVRAVRDAHVATAPLRRVGAPGDVLTEAGAIHHIQAHVRVLRPANGAPPAPRHQEVQALDALVALHQM
mmetsp:Transcript_72880/g.187944  ORF Transcript_72880/g.187944 Transcript_72880/m.187944 type:complete len:255 (+) Transcript_72880:801-1565(+)